MRTILAAACVLAASACAMKDRAAPGGEGLPDFTGMWMPASFAPDGTPLTAPSQAERFLPEVADAFAERQANYIAELDDPGRNCFPYGMPAHMFMTAQFPIEIIQTPGQVTMIFEVHNDVRRIYVDGRGHPSDLRPTMFGHSVGVWEGDTLVVDTVAVRDRQFPQVRSTQVRITERMTPVDGGERGRMIENAVTVEDPEVFAEPYERTVYFVEVPNSQMQEYFCSEDLWIQAYTGRSINLPWR